MLILEKWLVYVKFQCLTVMSMKIDVLQDVAPCGLVKTDRRFMGAYSICMT
jgi:hypothetical protein